MFLFIYFGLFTDAVFDSVDLYIALNSMMISDDKL
jgi:hypothetical protein